MQPKFNPNNQLIDLDGATLKVNDPTGALYATVTVNPNFTITTAKVSPNVFEKLDNMVAEGTAGLYKFVSRRHAADGSATPEQLAREYLAGMRQSKNREKFPKRGDKTR